MSKGLTPRSENYSEWYNELVKKAGLAEHSEVRGCMVIKPYGFAIWEKMQRWLDDRFKETGHSNAYFPLFIPKSYMSREAQHVEGFAKEAAVVTHHRLKATEEGVIPDPEAKLEEELIVRPTSETVIWNTYRNWIQSHRDLPILVNQWANVVRWELRTRLFLRTAEFLWQEGHTAHATKHEAEEETRQMLDIYARFAEEVMALPVIKGRKTEAERFAGAEDTLCIEALMQDGRALQAGTSHFLGQNFAKAFDVRFANAEGELEYVWGSSWGVSTRLMGALIMAHSDDKGLVLPPALAPVQVIIIPIYKKKAPETMEALKEALHSLRDRFIQKGISVRVDEEDSNSPGFKFAEAEMKGIPVRLALGPRDVENGTVEVVRRDTLEKEVVPSGVVVEKVEELLSTIQQSIFERAKAFRQAHTTTADDYAAFKEILETQGGFIWAHWDGTTETEEKIQEETKATIRCIPFEGPQEAGHCIYTGKPSPRRVLFAKAY